MELHLVASPPSRIGWATPLNVTVHRAAENYVDFRNRAARGSVCNGLLCHVWVERSVSWYVVSDTKPRTVVVYGDVDFIRNLLGNGRNQMIDGPIVIMCIRV
jgi:hypothetical protein